MSGVDKVIDMVQEYMYDKCILGIDPGDTTGMCLIRGKLFEI
jgi:predicted RNase H-like nuclease (RuvC/YqgF family)